MLTISKQHLILGLTVARPQPNGSNNDDYISRQAAMDRRSEAAWKNAPKRFLKEAAKVGLDAGKVEYESASVAPYDPEFSSKETPYDPDYASRAYNPNMADLVDDYVDEIVERMHQSGKLLELDISRFVLIALVRHIAEELKRPVELELARNRALLLGRIASYLVADEKGNILARIHALLHAIPRLAVENGYSSMRASALQCGASVEWLRKSRNKVCALLELDPPAHGVKTDEARAKYKTNAQNNHWRHQLYEAPTRKPNE